MELDMLERVAESKAGMLRQKGMFREALEVWKDFGRECKVIGSKAGEAVAWDKQALIYKNLGDYSSASSLHRQAETAFRALDMRMYLGNCLVNHAILLFEKLGKPAEARDKVEEAIGIYTEAESDVHVTNAAKLLDAIDDKLVEDATGSMSLTSAMAFLKETKAEKPSRKRPWWRVW